MEEIHGAEHMEEPKEEEGMDKKTQKSILAWVSGESASARLQLLK